MALQEYRPGELAPVSGQYEELNVLGARTGKIHSAQAGEPLPTAPRGFSWRLSGLEPPTPPPPSGPEPSPATPLAFRVASQSLPQRLGGL